MVLFNLRVPRPPCSVTSPWVKLRSPQAPSPSSCPGAAPAFQSLRLGSALSPRTPRTQAVWDLTPSSLPRCCPFPGGRGKSLCRH